MDYVLHLLLIVGIFIILALSLNLINGLCGQFSLGHAGFWGVGAYTSAIYTIHYKLPLPDDLNLLVALLVGLVASSLTGLFVGIPCLRLKGDYLAIATLGFGEIFRLIIVNCDFIGGPRGLTGIPKIAGLHHVILVALFTFIFMYRLKYSTHGRAIISIREDEIAAETMGVNLFLYKLISFTIGAGFAGVAGALFAHSQQFLHPNNFNFMWSVIILVMVILGGLGSLTGAVVGATIITLFPELLRFFGEEVAAWRMTIYSLLLIVLMLLRPSGIFGKHELNFKKLLNIFSLRNREAN